MLKCPALIKTERSRNCDLAWRLCCLSCEVLKAACNFNHIYIDLSSICLRLPSVLSGEMETGSYYHTGVARVTKVAMLVLPVFSFLFFAVMPS